MIIRRSVARKVLATFMLVLVFSMPMVMGGAARAGVEPFIGEIQLVAFNFAPKNFATCDGQIMSIAANTALFSLLGTTYGGDGQISFALPDLRGRVPIHQGQGPGLSPYTQGESGGNETVTLLTTNMPMHNHTATTTTPTVTAILKGQSTPAASRTPAGGAPALLANGNGYSSAAPDVNMHASAIVATATQPTTTIFNAGGSQPFSIRQPYLVLNYVIALYGIYPTRN